MAGKDEQKQMKSMDQNNSREVVLGHISDALKAGGNRSNLREEDQSFAGLYIRSADSNLKTFIESALELGVQVFHCSSKKEFKSHFRNAVDANGWSKINCKDTDLFKSLSLDSTSGYWTENTMDCEVAITDCEVISARTGTIVMSSSQVCGRSLPIHTPVHIIIGYEDQIVYDLPFAFETIQLKYQKGYPSAIFFSSGVSSTGDIEKTLVRGVHGPEEVYVYLIKN